ncbi:MAG: histidine--tRNA ligase [Kiritimatiellae bacterium]|nr:histidine--tRNA ligase [Kiritimatiellia bacterium]
MGKIALPPPKMTSNVSQPIQGTTDIVPPDIYGWQKIEDQARTILARYGFDEIRTPLIERSEVFTRSLGQATDVVQKEMYAFEDRGGRNIALRPEGTAGVMRYIAGAGPEAQDARLYYLGPMFRAERPQAGRKRQFHQLGVEVLGAPNPIADVECISLQVHLLKEWGIDNATIHINTRGLFDDQEAIKKGLKKSLEPHLQDLCKDCQRRYKVNVLRILDCKNEKCGHVVVNFLDAINDLLSDESKQYFNEVLEGLKRLDIPVVVQPKLVRGLDYYLHTVWEVMHLALGAQDAISGGGRYAIQVGSKTTEGVGFAIGLERILDVLRAGEKTNAKPTKKVDVWLASQGQDALYENLVLAYSLRVQGIRCGLDLKQKSLKAQMRNANRAGVSYVIICGEEEIVKETFLLKDMDNGTQEELNRSQLMEKLTSLQQIGD